MSAVEHKEMPKIEPIHRDPIQNAEAYQNVVGAEAAPARQPVETVDPVQASNKQELLGDRRGISMEIDPESGVLVTKVVDHRTEEVVYQAPPDRIVELARKMKRKYGPEGAGSGPRR
jgi:uncharacterized FlaG/YvyC family protein